MDELESVMLTSVADSSSSLDTVSEVPADCLRNDMPDGMTGCLQFLKDSPVMVKVSGLVSFQLYSI